ncbi:MAG: hypothetical protein EXS35_14010 [Pedosphaera sp.]|nr:hypothetical protein [Pedosphaera sp.]
MKTRTWVSIAALMLLTSLPAEAQLTNQDRPQVLDLSRFYRERFITATKTNVTFAPIVGEQHYDGLPFRIEGRGWVYGRKEADWVHSQPGRENVQYPDFIGITVGRTFDELHLLHAARWADVEGETIALLRLNYADGTKHEFPIGYGVHVRDEQRLRSEEKESLTDTNSNVVFRGEPEYSIYKSTARLFKSTLVNPRPEKIVATLDVVSTRRLSAYYPVAATVANRDAARARTVAVELDDERRFRRTTTIRVLDGNGKPIAGALVDAGMTVDKTSVIASPLRTATNGEAVVHYPGMRTTSLSVTVEKAGYFPQKLFWSAKNYGNAWWQQAVEYAALMKSFVPETNTVILLSSNSPAANLPPR